MSWEEARRAEMSWEELRRAEKSWEELSWVAWEEMCWEEMLFMSSSDWVLLAIQWNGFCLRCLRPVSQLGGGCAVAAFGVLIAATMHPEGFALVSHHTLETKKTKSMVKFGPSKIQNLLFGLLICIPYSWLIITNSIYSPSRNQIINHPYSSPIVVRRSISAQV